MARDAGHHDVAVFCVAIGAIAAEGWFPLEASREEEVALEERTHDEGAADDDGETGPHGRPEMQLGGVVGEVGVEVDGGDVEDATDADGEVDEAEGEDGGEPDLGGRRHVEMPDLREGDEEEEEVDDDVDDA